MDDATAVTMREPAWRPSPRAKLLWTLEALVGWVVVLAVGSSWLLAGSGLPRTTRSALLVTVAVVAVVHVTVMPQWRFRVHRWEVSDTAVHTRTGWFTQESRVAPLSRLQTLDTERGPVHRILGLADVTITTASSAGAVKIPGLDLATAERTVAELTAVAGRNQADAT